MRQSLSVVMAAAAVLMCSACTGKAASVPEPTLGTFLHANYSVTNQFKIKADTSHPESVVVVSKGPGLTPDAPVQGGTQDVQLLTYDKIAKRWNVALDAANKVVAEGFSGDGAMDPASTGPTALLPQDHTISDAKAQVVTFQPGQTSLVIYAVDEYYNHPPGLIAVVNLSDQSPQVSYYDAESGLTAPTVSGKPGSQRLTVTAAFSAPGDPGCCPARYYTQVIGSTDTGHASPPSVGVVEDDRPWLGAYVTSDSSVPGVLAVVGTADNTPASSLLHIGDRIVGVVGETPKADSSNLSSPVFDLLALHKPTDQVTLLVLRSAKRIQLPATLVSRMSSGFTTSGSKQATIGVSVVPSPVGRTRRDVVITSVAADSVASKGGLAVGDEITAVGNVVVHDPLDLLVGLWGHAFEAVDIKIVRADGSTAEGSITPTQDDLSLAADPL
jgi:hypothetical protein